MTREPPVGVLKRIGHHEIAVLTPSGIGVVDRRELAEFILGTMDPDIEVLGQNREVLARITLSHDGLRLYLDFGTARYQMWASHGRKLGCGAMCLAPLRPLAVPGDPTLPIYYQIGRGASA